MSALFRHPAPPPWVNRHPPRAPLRRVLNHSASRAGPPVDYGDGLPPQYTARQIT